MYLNKIINSKTTLSLATQAYLYYAPYMEFMLSDYVGVCVPSRCCLPHWRKWQSTDRHFRNSLRQPK